MNIERDRVISITLSEAEWQALVARHPQPVTWLREQIRSDLQRQVPVPSPGMTALPRGDAPGH